MIQKTVTIVNNMIQRIGWRRMILAGAIKLAVSILLFACTKSQPGMSSNNNTTSPIVASGAPAANPETTQIVYLSNPTGGNLLKAVLFIPSSAVPVPAVVVQHGSGGLWSSTDSTNTKMSLQFKGWVDSFRVHKIAALFVDSYTARGVKTFHNVAPPANLPIAAEFVRPRDAYTGLDYLRSLPAIIPTKIALLGFSHGGTSVLSTMVDATAVAKATPWSLISSNITYTDGVLAPAAKPVSGGFVAAVSFYPGAAMFSYYGKPGTPSNGKYIPYAPVMIHAAALDPLYTTTYSNTDNNTQISSYDGLIMKAQLNPASAAMTKHEYAGAEHSFDGVTAAGADADASKLARTRTIAFLRQYLFN
jgi:dienelactone hydrolase